MLILNSKAWTEIADDAVGAATDATFARIRFKFERRCPGISHM